MNYKPISLNKAKDLKLRIITYFRPKFNADPNIAPRKNINIGTKDNPKIVNCDIKKPRRNYDHFEWIKKLEKEIDGDPERIAYIVENAKGEKALGVN